MKIFTKFLLISLGFLLLQVANASDPFKKVSESPKSSLKLKREMCKGGFYFNFGLFKPTNNFFLESDVEKPDSTKFGLGESFEFGNMFKIVNLDNFGIGVRTTWLNINYTKLKTYNELTDLIIHTSFFKIGPYFTIGMGEKMALDLYYQFSPQYLTDIYLDAAPEEDDTYTYFGFSHSIGATYRFSILAVGFDTNFGKAKYVKEDDDPEEINFNPRFPYLRFYIGLMF